MVFRLLTQGHPLQTDKVVEQQQAEQDHLGCAARVQRVDARFDGQAVHVAQGVAVGPPPQPRHPHQPDRITI
jgi:hypothetical protein